MSIMKQKGLRDLVAFSLLIIFDNRFGHYQKNNYCGFVSFVNFAFQNTIDL